MNTVHENIARIAMWAATAKNRKQMSAPNQDELITTIVQLAHKFNDEISDSRMEIETFAEQHLPAIFPDDPALFARFRHEYRWKYEFTDDLHAAYTRYLKCNQNILLSLNEFLIEAQCYNEDIETLTKVYEAISHLIEQGKLPPSEAYQYAHYRWCLHKPEAIVAYEVETLGGWKWIVNNCDTEISIEAAVQKVFEEWGFVEKTINIIGTPYYESTDWQYIRFNAGHMSWLWKNSSLYQTMG